MSLDKNQPAGHDCVTTLFLFDSNQQPLHSAFCVVSFGLCWVLLYTCVQMPEPRKLILRTHLSLGDVVCFTAALREIRSKYQDEYQIDVRTPFPSIFEHSPHVTTIADEDPEATVIDCHYDTDKYATVHRSNQHPVHLIESYCADLSNSLGLPLLRPTEQRGQIFLSPAEYGYMSMPHERYNCQRYWVVVAGGKHDAPVKWWIPEYYQRVIDYFRGRIQFVQIGHVGAGHSHPDLRGVIDLRGQTSVRQLIHVMHAASGVLCGITAAMHLAAAVPLPSWQHRPRPCVVIAGGREPRSWYGYREHRILETIGALPCCRVGGCWHSHVVPTKGIKGERLCERVIDGSPKCMWMVRPEQVILAIEQYLEGECI
jgi:ADP-heptose:LPS heptosyltransferase